MNKRIHNRALLLVAAIVISVAASTRLEASQTAPCAGQNTTIPFDDVLPGNIFFCSIAEAFFTGLSNGTTPTTYSPGDPVPREQMAAFVTRTLDQSLKRRSRQAAVSQLFSSKAIDVFGLTTVGDGPFLLKSDGADIWVANGSSATVSRVRASDGKLLDTWTGATNALGVLAAKGLIFVTGQLQPGQLYQIDPTQPVGAVTTLTSALGPSPLGIAFDGSRVWTANVGGSVSIVSFNPVTVMNVTTGFVNPLGLLFDGSNIWVTDSGDAHIKKLDSSGNILQSLTVGDTPYVPAFDGTNIWVPNFNSSTLTVVRAKDSIGNPLASPFVLTTLSGNGLANPKDVAFDGQRILAVNASGISLWKATDLTPLGSVATGPNSVPWGACSDGLNFWITLYGPGKVARF